MKTFTITALASILSVALARDVILERSALAKRQPSSNLATFTGDLGGIAVTPITCSGNADRQFEVNGNTFVGFAAAAQRSCDIQNNACANKANAGGQTFTVSDCNTQQQQCNSVQEAAVGSCSGAAASSSVAATTAAAAVAAATTTSKSCNSATTTSVVAATTTPCGSAKFRKH